MRFITSHPEEMDEALVDAMAAASKTGLFLHLPPQSGSDAVLRRMARGYDSVRYREIAAQLRERIPGVQLGADVIVGFPGESEADFDSTLRLMDEVRFSQAFLFRYSPRPGTPAWGRLDDDVPEDVKRRRHAVLQAHQLQWQEERHRGLVGSSQRVLVEGGSRRDPRRLFGRNLAADRIVFDGEPGLADTFVDVRITGATALTLTGDVVTAAQGAVGAGARA